MLYNAQVRAPSSLRRSLIIAAAIIVGLAALGVFGMVFVYPRMGAWMIRSKVAPKLAQRLGREVRFGSIHIGFGHVVLRDIDIRGPLDGDLPLVHCDRIDVDFDGWHSLYGSVVVGAATVDGVIVTARRDAEGRDNVRDLLDRLRGGDADGAGGGGGDSFGRMRPTTITVTHVRVLADDAQTGATALVGDGEATWTPTDLSAQLRGATLTSANGSKAAAATLEIHKQLGSPPTVTIDGGELALWPRLSLSGIAGSIVALPDRPGQYGIDVAGGYGGVPDRLWTAKGTLDPANVSAVVDLEAAKFQLDRLAPILRQSPVLDYQATSVDATLHAEVDRTGAKFRGGFHLHGLNVGHPMLADKEVRDLDLSGEVDGSFDRKTSTLELTRGDFVTRGVPFALTGSIVRPPHRVEEVPVAVVPPTPTPTPGTDEPEKSEDRRGPHGVKSAVLHFVIPPIACQSVLDAIPTEMAPYMAGYHLKGNFDVDLHLAVDWTDLDATKLDGHVGIRGCKVTDEPADSPKRLKDEFEHYVELEPNQWISFVVGPTNPDFVPLDQISPYVVKSIMSTEDSAFYSHHGFITSEFQTALVNDLKAGGFKFGASSITMQMVKNVLLFREKTLARKLQELFLTWHVENTLTKDRIMEIYLNVIEYGPALYGIGPAAQHYFGKAAKDLTPNEAAFFSSILPAPKERYKQYCEGTLTKWTTGKIQRILAIMLKRDRLTQEEYDKAMETPLLFNKDGSETEEDCLKRTKKAIKSSRSTNPPPKK